MDLNTTSYNEKSIPSPAPLFREPALWRVFAFQASVKTGFLSPPDTTTINLD